MLSFLLLLFTFQHRTRTSLRVILLGLEVFNKPWATHLICIFLFNNEAVLDHLWVVWCDALPVVDAFAGWFFVIFTICSAASKDVRKEVLDVKCEASDLFVISLGRTLTNRLTTKRGRLTNGRAVFACPRPIELLRLLNLIADDRCLQRLRQLGLGESARGKHKGAVWVSYIWLYRHGWASSFDDRPILLNLRLINKLVMDVFGAHREATFPQSALSIEIVSMTAHALIERLW